MRKFKIENQNLVIGTAREIKTLYKNAVKHDFFPIFVGEPKFNMSRMYGLVFGDDPYTLDRGIIVVSGDTALGMIAD